MVVVRCLDPTLKKANMTIAPTIKRFPRTSPTITWVCSITGRIRIIRIPTRPISIPAIFCRDICSSMSIRDDNAAKRGVAV